MKNRLLARVTELFQQKRILIELVRERLNNWVQIQHSRSRRRIKFLVFLIAGLVASTLIALNITPSALPENSYKTSWIGNSFGGGSKWVQIQISALYVTPDGTAYTNSGWDEAGREAGIYKDGDAIGMASTLHGWGRGGGRAVTANDKYLFVAMSQWRETAKPGEDYPPEKVTWFCVRRYNLSGEPAPFAGGRGYDGSMLIINTTAEVSGLAQAENELYVSDPVTNRIRVYNTETMTELRSFPAERPGQIAVDRQGNLWLIQTKDKSNPSKILQYAKTGNLLSKQITDVADPTALAVDNKGRLLVADNGPQQQVLIYDIAQSPKRVDTFGTKGGIASGKPGEVTPEKLYGLTGVGADAAGNIYVSLDGFNRSGTDVRKYSPDRKLQWQLLGLQFLDTADADPATDGVDVFTKNEHFVMDYSKSSGKEWSYQGYTLDPFRYPDDGRLHTTPTAPFVRRLEGKRFLFLSSEMMSERLLVYRFDGAIAVPCRMVTQGSDRDNDPDSWPPGHPTRSSWLWHDKNGDGSIQGDEYEKLGAETGSIWGWEVDSKGDIWQASEAGYIKHYPYQGLDKYGCPSYTGAAAENIPMPAPFNKLLRIKYFPDIDVMYLGGYTSDRPHTGGEWGIVGTEIVRYDNWSKEKKVRSRITLPYEPNADPMIIIKAMDVAGDRVFAVDSRKAEVYVYDARTGAFLIKLSPGAEVAGETGWVDIPYALRAYRRGNGEYVVFVEEDAKAKVIMYRLTSTN